MQMEFRLIEWEVSTGQEVWTSQPEDDVWYPGGES